jgi:hypothetical protein
MSMAAGAASPISVLPHSKSFFACILGVLYAPRATFHAVARTRSWLAVLTFTFVASAVASAVVLETEVGRFALLDWWEGTAIAFGGSFDDGRYAAMGRASQQGWLYAVASAFASGPALAVALSGLLLAALRTPASTAVTYRQVLTVVAHAGVILALRQVIAAPAIYARGTLASPLTLRLLLPRLDEASLPARFSSGLDLFVVWWIIVLAIGMSVLYRRSARSLAAGFLGAYVAIAAILAVAMAFTGGTS